MMSSPRPFSCLLPVLLLVLSSCAKIGPPPPTPLTAAEEQFSKICREEMKYDVHVTRAGQTVWVYIPLTNNIFDIKASAKNQAPKAAPLKSWSIQFLESKFQDKTFAVSFDIEFTKKYDKDNGIQNKYSEEYSKKQREVLTALTRAYFDVGRLPGDIIFKDKDKQKTHDNLVNTYLPPNRPPDFFVMVFADIKRGIAAKTVTYFPDMKMALANPPAIPSEEFTKRYIAEIYGDPDLIGDKAGSHLKIEDIQLPDFLAKQIENRVKIKFTQSAFPPKDDAQTEIWTIVAETLRLYHFSDFQNIKLIDLKNEKESLYDKSQL